MLKELTNLLKAATLPLAMLAICLALLFALSFRVNLNTFAGVLGASPAASQSP